MNNLPFFSRLLAQWAGLLYAFLHFTTQHGLLGVSLSGWLKFLPLLLGVLAWLNGWGLAWIVAGLLLAVAARLLYWRAKRNGYIRFLARPGRSAPAAVPPLADYEKIAVRATGRFSVAEREEYILQKPADYWRVPLGVLRSGANAFMVQHAPGRYLYQFIQPGTLLTIQSGLLLYGRRPPLALALTFLSTWGPEFASSPNRVPSRGQESDSRPSLNGSAARLQRQIYLTFPNEQAQAAVWNNLLRDARRPIHARL